MTAVSNHIPSENDLIQGCIEENPVMQRSLYDRFSSKMYGVCLRYAGNTEDANDILQEGFIKVFKNISKFRKEGSFEGWIRRIFVNTAIEQFRKKVKVYNVTEVQENTIKPVASKKNYNIKFLKSTVYNQFKDWIIEDNDYDAAQQKNRYIWTILL